MASNPQWKVEVAGEGGGNVEMGGKSSCQVLEYSPQTWNIWHQCKDRLVGTHAVHLQLVRGRQKSKHGF